MIQEFGPDIWLTDGPVVNAAAGFHYPTRMAIIRLSPGGLVIWSPVVLSDALKNAVDALGKVEYLVPPNSLHHVFLSEWQQAFPLVKTLAPPGLRKKRPDLKFDADFTDASVADWNDEIDHVIMRGNRITEEVAFFHRASGTVLFTDIIQHLPQGWFKGWRAIVARLDLMTEKEAAVPRKFRLAFKDRAAARQTALKILSWPAQKVIMAHGAPVTQDAQDFLRRAFRWLVD